MKPGATALTWIPQGATSLATALVNPRRVGATYPNDELCGVAVAYKFAQALKQRDHACLPDDFLTSVLDLVAMGLVADQMALVDENRVLVKKGLERFNDRRREPLEAALNQSVGSGVKGPGIGEQAECHRQCAHHPSHCRYAQPSFVRRFVRVAEAVQGCHRPGHRH